MKFPSLKSLAESIETTLNRFLFEILFALAGTTAAIVKTEWPIKTDIDENWCTRVMLVANLGLLLSLAATLYIEAKGIKGAKKIIIKFIAALFALSLLLLLDPAARSSDYFRFLLFSLGFHLLVSFAAFTGKDHVQGFWQFNKTIFLRFLTGVLYSGVLYLGLAAAIAAANFLFNLKIEWRTYEILWYCIAGIFNTVFFLAGVPADTRVLDSDLSYPKGLKIFTQYVLIPLATVYLVILLAYEVKLLAQWGLPKGLVSNLILGYAVFGILSILLIYPIREQENNKWIKTYARSFYFLLIPLLVLLFLALGRRIFAYGITEERYFLLILACWLLFITVYFLLSKKQNIKLIPLSLCVLTLLSIYGPQSAFSISTYSQRHILISIFKTHNAFKNDKLIPLHGAINKADGNEAIEKLRYLIYNKELSTLQPYISVNLDAVKDSLSKKKSNRGDYYSRNGYWLKSEELTWMRKYLGLTYVPGRIETEVTYSYTNTYTFTSLNNRAVNVLGYDFIVPVSDVYGYSAKSDIDNIAIVEKGDSAQAYQLSLNNEQVSFDLKSFADSLIIPDSKLKSYKKNVEGGTANQNFVIPENGLSVTKQTPHYTVTFKISHIMFSSIPNDRPQINNLEGCYLVKKK